MDARYFWEIASVSRDKFWEFDEGRVSVPGRAAEAGRPKGRPYNTRRYWLVVKCYCILGLHVFISWMMVLLYSFYGW